MRALVLSLIAMLLPLRAAADDVTIFAAASLGGVLDTIAAEYEVATGDRMVLSYAGSSALAQQIRAGAPADIFISASADWMDAVQAAGLIDAGTRTDLLGNALVLVGHAAAKPVDIGADLDLAGMLGDGRLVMALVDAVPAGQYGKAALTSLGLWDAVAANVVQADNVRAALALVALGEAEYGIVYATDAVAEPDVHVFGTFPDDSHPPIVYPVAAVTGGRDATAALAWLTGPAARARFVAQGFAVLTPE